MAIFNSYVKLPKGMPHIHIVTFEFSRKVIQYWSPPGRPSTGHHKCATAGPLGPCFTDGYGMGCLHATAAGSLDRWRWRERNRLKKKNVESLTTKAFSRSSKSSKNESRQSLVILPNHFFPNVSSQTGDAPRRASHQLRGNMGSRNGCWRLRSIIAIHII